MMDLFFKVMAGNLMEDNSHSREYSVTAPSFIWLFLFFLIPSLIIFAYAFKPHNIYGDVTEGWTLQSIYDLWNWSVLTLLWRTFWLSAICTFICLFLALPMGYYLTSIPPKWKNLLLMMIIVPFWSSFLIRIFAWKTILHPDGMLNTFLIYIGLIAPTTTLLYNSSTVLFVMVYTLIPFAVLPIFAAASKFNFQLIEAAIDLGASRFQAFVKVFIPGIRKGIGTAILMVFIPAIGTYIIPDLVGGTNSEMLGNKIAQKTFVERSLPQASALSALLALVIFIPIFLGKHYFTRSRKLDLEARNRE
ncbi:MAG: ABC transporter permease [Parachlamydiaceae bacterium]|nr:ABC transporter permease [Parachlamydiaceae bacterium]